MRLQAGVALSDTWLLSLSGDSFQWRPLAPGSAVAPWARSRHGMALLGRVLYVFGGVDASGAALPGGALSTLHLDSLHWAALAPLQGVPHPGPLHSAAMAPVRGCAVLHGGLGPSGDSLTGSWRLCPPGGSWQLVSTTGGTMASGGVASMGGGLLALVGGGAPAVRVLAQGPEQGVVWAHPAVSGAGPGEYLVGASLVHAGRDTGLLVYGGHNSSYHTQDTLWRLPYQGAGCRAGAVTPQRAAAVNSGHTCGGSSVTVLGGVVAQ